MNAKYNLEEDMEHLEFHLYVTGMNKDTVKAVDAIMRKFTHDIMEISE